MTAGDGFLLFQGRKTAPLRGDSRANVGSTGLIGGLARRSSSVRVPSLLQSICTELRITPLDSR
jgi:hypothetical protein